MAAPEPSAPGGGFDLVEFSTRRRVTVAMATGFAAVAAAPVAKAATE
mgnify:CR=1 FL=1